MKNRRTVLAAVLCAALAPAAFCQVQEPGRITVSGEAEIRVVPDEVILAMGIETSDATPGAAKSRNDALVKKTFAVAEKFGIEAKYVRTDYAGIEPRWDILREQKKFLGYFVRKTVTFTIRDLSKFEDILQAVLDAGVSQVYGTDFRTTELRMHRDRARTLAVGAAREKAVLLAGELGRKIGRPVAITEEYDRWYGLNSAPFGYRQESMTQNVVQEAAGGGYSGDTFAPGQLTVSSRVTVTFEIGE